MYNLISFEKINEKNGKLGHKVCPFMSNVAATSLSLYWSGVPCLEDNCQAWLPEIDHYYACTLELRNQKAGDCKIEGNVEEPDVPQEMSCDGCQYYQRFQCKPIPAHCGIIPKNK